jgi:hypothetical protein
VGKVLERFVDFIEEITIFATLKELEILPKLTCLVWKTNLMFFTDLSVHLNELNLKLQGFGKSIDVMFSYIKSFEMKI